MQRIMLGLIVAFALAGCAAEAADNPTQQPSPAEIGATSAADAGR